MKKNHITITNNETGETILDFDTDVLFVSCQDPKEGTRCIASTRCHIVDLASAVSGMQTLINNQLAQHPFLGMLLASGETEIVKKTEEN